MLKKENRSTRRSTLRRKHPRVLTVKLAIAFALVLVATFLVIKVEPYTHDAKVRRELESKLHSLTETKNKLEQQTTTSQQQLEAQQKQLQETQQKLQETEKQLQAKRKSQIAYAATVAPAITKNTNCISWMEQAGIQLTPATTKLILNESGCRVNAVNPSSGACGIPQAYPCSKLPCTLDEAGAVCQLKWMDNYVKNRYGTWDSALSTWYSRCGSPQGCWY